MLREKERDVQPVGGCEGLGDEVKSDTLVACPLPR